MLVCFKPPVATAFVPLQRQWYTGAKSLLIRTCGCWVLPRPSMNTKTLDGPQWPEPVRVLSETASEYGRTIKVSGAITIGQLPGLFNSLLKPLNSQNPDQFSIAIEATVHYAKDPGSAFDATLKDSFKQEQFPNIKLIDSKGS